MPIAVQQDPLALWLQRSTQLDNKYTRWYYAIIANAQTRINIGYVEKHHIIPKSLGGSNSKDNLAKLTAREHFLCHWLLTKMTQRKNQIRMAYSFMQMCHHHSQKQKRYIIPSRTYETLKVNMSKIMSKREFSSEWRNKISISAKNRGIKERDIRSKRMKEQHKAGMFKKK